MEKITFFSVFKGDNSSQQKYQGGVIKRRSVTIRLVNLLLGIPFFWHCLSLHCQVICTFLTVFWWNWGLLQYCSGTLTIPALHNLVKGQGPRMVLFGRVKSQNMTRWKNATSHYICNLWLTTVQNVQWKNFIASFHEFSMPQRVAKKHKNSKNRHFSPIFGDKLVNWNMKSQTRF